MRFSIIIPTHNAENYIRKALDSIKQQTFTDYELIVVCDNCNDHTKDIALEYGAIVQEVNNNCDGPTRSCGLDMAQGEWVLFMDDDDWWLHEYVLWQLDDKIKQLGEQEVDVLAFSFIMKGVRYADPLGCGGRLWPAVWNKCWKRSIIGDTRFPNIYSVSDSYFHVWMMNKTLKLVTWDMPLYYYNYLRPGSISWKDKEEKV